MFGESHLQQPAEVPLLKGALMLASFCRTWRVLRSCRNYIPDVPDNFLNLSPPPALPGTMFGASICNNLLGSPLPCMDSPDIHQAFYGEAFNDFNLGNFNDIADSSFSFGCFNN